MFGEKKKKKNQVSLQSEPPTVHSKTLGNFVAPIIFTADSQATGMRALEDEIK